MTFTRGSIVTQEAERSIFVGVAVGGEGGLQEALGWGRGGV